MDFISIAFAGLALIIGLVSGYFFKKVTDEKRLVGAKANAEAIVDDAIKQAQTLKREALFEAKEENLKYRNEIENELKERRNEVNRLENRIIQREENLDKKSANLDKRELNLDTKEEGYQQRKAELETKEASIQ